MIRYGPAGIPLSCKGRTLKDGIEDVHSMGLNALEVQMVRNYVEQRPPEDFEIGLTMEEIMHELVIEVGKPDGEDFLYSSKPDVVIEEDDILTVMHNPSLATSHADLRFLGKLARFLDVKLSVHSQYYIDLIRGDEVSARSLDNIFWSGVVARELGAEMVVTHIGPYHDYKKKEAMKRVKGVLEELVQRFRENGINVKLGIEASGKQEVFGSMSEIISLARSIEGVVPVINHAHVHSREDGSLKRPEDFEKLFHKVAKFTGPEIYSHFSGVEYDAGNEVRYTPIKKGDLKFDPLAEALLDTDYDFVLISSSPLLEHDAMYMKVITERILSKKIARERKMREKAEREAQQEKEKKGEADETDEQVKDKAAGKRGKKEEKEEKGKKGSGSPEPEANENPGKKSKDSGTKAAKKASGTQTKKEGKTQKKNSGKKTDGK